MDEISLKIFVIYTINLLTFGGEQERKTLSRLDAKNELNSKSKFFGTQGLFCLKNELFQ